MHNQSDGKEFVRGELTFRETISQQYTENSCTFSAGIVSGHPVDSMYFKLERQNDEDIVIIMRPDEIATLAWCLVGVLQTKEVDELLAKRDPSYERSWWGEVK